MVIFFLKITNLIQFSKSNYHNNKIQNLIIQICCTKQTKIISIMVVLIFSKLKKKKKKRHGDLVTILEKFEAWKEGVGAVILDVKEVGGRWEWQQERRGLGLVPMEWEKEGEEPVEREWGEEF